MVRALVDFSAAAAAAAAASKQHGMKGDPTISVIRHNIVALTRQPRNYILEITNDILLFVFELALILRDFANDVAQTILHIHNAACGGFPLFRPCIFTMPIEHHVLE